MIVVTIKNNNNNNNNNNNQDQSTIRVNQPSGPILSWCKPFVDCNAVFVSKIHSFFLQKAA